MMDTLRKVSIRILPIVVVCFLWLNESRLQSIEHGFSPFPFYKYSVGLIVAATVLCAILVFTPDNRR